MRQIVTSLRTGTTELIDLPAPTLERREVLIRTRCSLVSQGTEKMLVEFGKASLISKVRAHPDRVKQVLAKIRSEGLFPTIEAVFRRLDQPLPLGYCNVGSVVAVGSEVTRFAIGDRVASNGAHAEMVSVAENLCARIPNSVSDSEAAFTVIGAIGLQGVRLVKPEIGETVVVIGLGLIGQITAQLLRAAGCNVIGFDFDAAKVEAAAKFGISAHQSGGELDIVRYVIDTTGGLGADAVIIAASTSSNDVIAQSARMSRKRGRVVLVGVVGLAINRADFYEKELTFQVSCSYGPGRYDDVYEDRGLDYPAAYVRWTENRNFQAVLQSLETNRLQVEQLITRRVPFERFDEIYGNMKGGGLASLLIYGGKLPSDVFTIASTAQDRGERRSDDRSHVSVEASTIKVCESVLGPNDGALAIIGAGNFTKMTAMPALAAVRAPIKTIVSAGGVSGTSLAKKYRVPFSSTDFSAVIADPDIRGVIITTRHNLHAKQSIAALTAGKHVLVEKPLCLTLDELQAIEAAMARPDGSRRDANFGTLTVGFNRRFSPHARKMRSLFGATAGPVAIVATMNAGAIPPNHWVHNPEVGGGRLIGEACHFIDLAVFLSGSLIETVAVEPFADTMDSASILLRHVNGSISVVNYLANGHRELSKERVEIHAAGHSATLDNFRELRGYGFKSFSKLKTRQDKGHSQQFAQFVDRVKVGGSALIPWAEVANVTRASFAVVRSISERRRVAVADVR
jgi:predicted dehydrogenase/threonine dehydrogenase-like Zn-dependent dehydrogenase